MKNLGEIYEKTLHRISPAERERDNYRIQQEYIRMLKEDPVIFNNIMVARTYDSSKVIGVDI